MYKRVSITKDEPQNYKNIYKQIQNKVKDIVITRLLSQVMIQDKEIKKLLFENKILKDNLLTILKKAILKKLVPTSEKIMEDKVPAHTLYSDYTLIRNTSANKSKKLNKSIIYNYKNKNYSNYQSSSSVPDTKNSFIIYPESNVNSQNNMNNTSSSNIIDAKLNGYINTLYTCGRNTKFNLVNNNNKAHSIYNYIYNCEYSGMGYKNKKNFNININNSMHSHHHSRHNIHNSFDISKKLGKENSFVRNNSQKSIDITSYKKKKYFNNAFFAHSPGGGIMSNCNSCSLLNVSKGADNFGTISKFNCSKKMTTNNSKVFKKVNSNSRLNGSGGNGANGYNYGKGVYNSNSNSNCNTVNNSCIKIFKAKKKKMSHKKNGSKVHSNNPS